ncbi:MAG: hypothetical protein ACYDDA_03805 [Acidiferrobacteraceae bacterium]
MKVGDPVRVEGSDVHGKWTGSTDAVVTDPHANSIRVTHVASDGREYENANRHIRTVLVKTVRGKDYEVPEYAVRRVVNPRRRHSAKWDRCVAAVKRGGSAADPYAVCTKSLGTRAYNPRDPEMARAAKLYRSFRERVPDRIKRVGVPPLPRIAVDIGRVEYVGYRTTHGKKLTLYQHDFAPASRPLLCVSPDGRQILLIGGRYVFTDRGIVDRDVTGRQIVNPSHGRKI